MNLDDEMFEIGQPDDDGWKEITIARELHSLILGHVRHRNNRWELRFERKDGDVTVLAPTRHAALEELRRFHR
jgi:hypothetical protein